MLGFFLSVILGAYESWLPQTLIPALADGQWLPRSSYRMLSWCQFKSSLPLLKTLAKPISPCIQGEHMVTKQEGRALQIHLVWFPAHEQKIALRRTVQSLPAKRRATNSSVLYQASLCGCRFYLCTIFMCLELIDQNRIEKASNTLEVSLNIIIYY